MEIPLPGVCTAMMKKLPGELTLRIRNEAITYNLDQTLRYSANYDKMTANKIDVTDEACEEYFQEVLGFSDVTTSGSPTPFDDPIVSTTSPTLTLFGESDFLLFEEANAFLGLEDDPDSPKLDPSYYDPEGDIQMLEAILNSDPAPSLLNHEQSAPSFKNELKACEAKTIKSPIDEPREVELKDLPPHLEYTFLEDDNKLPVIIAKELGDKEKAALIKVLKSHKRAIAWKLSDIQGAENLEADHLSRLEKSYENVLDPKEINETFPLETLSTVTFRGDSSASWFADFANYHAGKLKTHWSGPFTIAKVFPYGTVELSQADGPNFKVNGHQIKNYFGGDVPQLVVPDIQTSPLIKLSMGELGQAQRPKTSAS
nr:reverse transcriptase domain-containing protein [Tanacetum cinerariifolium]